MKQTICGLMLAGALVASPVGADTVYLKNGVQFDGIVESISSDPELFRVKSGDRTMTYRADEIERVEKNEKSGKRSLEDIKARWEERNRQLTEETGLTAEQRRLVRGLMYELKTDVVSKRVAIRERLMALQKEFDAYKYLAAQLPSVSILIAPNLMEALAYMDPSRAVELLQNGAQSNYYGTRVMAIDLLGRIGHNASKALIARGLADHRQEVQISAAYALAGMSAREATPALIGLLANPDQRVSNASRESLQALWANKLTDPKPGSVDEWKAFWNAQEKPTTPIELAALEPLSNAEEEITSSIDTNHGAEAPVEPVASGE